MSINTGNFCVLAFAALALSGGALPASAAHEHDFLHQRIAMLDCIGDRILCDYTTELQAECRWPPRQADRDLYEVFCALEKCSAQVHSFYEGRRSKYQMRKRLAATRQILENAKYLCLRMRLSPHIRQSITDFDRALCAVETCYSASAPSILRPSPSHTPHFGYSIGLIRMSL